MMLIVRTNVLWNTINEWNLFKIDNLIEFVSFVRIIVVDVVVGGNN